jgi:hypothetical protein
MFLQQYHEHLEKVYPQTKFSYPDFVPDWYNMIRLRNQVFAEIDKYFRDMLVGEIYKYLNHENFNLFINTTWIIASKRKADKPEEFGQYNVLNCEISVKVGEAGKFTDFMIRVSYDEIRGYVVKPESDKISGYENRELHDILYKFLLSLKDENSKE